MKNILVIILASIALYSCEKSILDDDFSTYNYIDINNDSINDYLIYYWGIGTTDIPQSGASWNAEIKSLRDNSFLYNDEDASYFLSPGELISLYPSSGKIWKDSSQIDLISIKLSNGKWDEEWTSLVEALDDYYIGLLFNTDRGSEIGWIKLLIDTEKGKISVEQKDYTNQEEISIPK